MVRAADRDRAAAAPAARGDLSKRCSVCIAATGIRLGEAIALDRDDVDLADAGCSPSGRRSSATPGWSRCTHGHRRAGRLRRRRDRLCPHPRSHTFFVSSVGTALLHNGVHHTFNQLTTDLGLRTATVRPRVHDLRHSFAVRTLIDWHRGRASTSTHACRCCRPTSGTSTRPGPTGICPPHRS